MNQSEHQSRDERDGVPTLLPDAERRGPAGPGVQIGNFQLQVLLGRGGMGEVWKAWDIKAERLVVLKLVPPELQRAEEEMARVKATFQRVHALQHQHICPLYLLDEDPRFGWYLVMKFIDGQTLSSYRATYAARHGEFPVEQVVRVLRPVGEALDYAHRHKVIHRDVKPQNILVEGDGEDVQVVDFGLAAEIRTTVSRYTQVQMDTSGTRPYMAPEQWKGQIQDARTDQYALAVVAYELLAGHLPFESADFDILRACVLNDPPEAIEDQAETVNRALLVALGKRREERFGSCVEFVQAICGEGFAVPVPMPSPLKTAVKPSAKVPPSVITNSIGMKLALIPAGTFLMGSDESPEELVRCFPDADAKWFAGEHPQHRVRISQTFQMGQFPVTVGQFRCFVEDAGYKTEAETGGGGHTWTGTEWKLNPDVNWRHPGFAQGDDHPVAVISWNDANAFCRWLRRKERRAYRLPNEAEWEYGCRAGSRTRYSFGDNPAQLGESAWYRENSVGATHPVAQKQSNAWGLYDMHGNVWEWCSDWADPYAATAVDDPTGPTAGSNRVLRGGGWLGDAGDCRSAHRNGYTPGSRSSDLGFRVALSLVDASGWFGVRQGA